MNIISYFRHIWYGRFQRQLDREEVLLKSIYSAQENNILLQSGIDWDIYEKYKYVKEIHKILEVYETNSGEMVRVGRDYDGGYIMLRPFSRNMIAYSIGICDDVSWDKDMAKLGYDIFQYDHTIRKLPANDPKFHFRRIGVCGTGNNNPRLNTLEKMMSMNNHDGEGYVLKIDVEGAEWDVLNSVDNRILDKFDQIVIELHGLVSDIQMHSKIIACLKKLTSNHSVIHIHANNNKQVYFCRDLITPDVIEITLVRKSLYDMIKKRSACFSLLDMPCNKYLEEVTLGKWNVDIQ